MFLETPNSTSPSAAAPSTGAALKPKRSLGDRILRAGFVVLAAHICVRVVGYVMTNRITNGYSLAVSDAYNVIWESVLNTAFLIGEQCLGPAYLPVFTSAREKEGEGRAWHFTSILFNAQALILIGVVTVLMAFPSQVVRVLTKWDSHIVEVQRAGSKANVEVVSTSPETFVIRVPSGDGALIDQTVPRAEILNAAAVEKELAGRVERFDYARSMLRWSALGLLGLSLASLTYMILNAYKEFFWAAFGDAMVKIGFLAGALVGIHQGVHKGDWRYLALGVVLGGALKLLTHLVALKWSRIKQYRLSLNLNDPYVRTFIALVVPLLAGIFISRFRDNVVQYVLTSRENLPTYYSLGRKISGSVNSLIPYALSIALLPFFCDISARNDNKQLGEVLTRVIRMLVWFFVPLSLVLAAGALPISLALFGGENIHVKEAEYSTVVAQIFSIEMIFVAVEMMVMQAFFSSRRMIAPTIAGLLFSGATAAAAKLLGDYLTDPREILIGLTVCLVLARALKVIVLVAMLKSTVPVFPLAENIGFLLRTIVAGALTAACAWGVALLLNPIVNRHLEKASAGEAEQALSKVARVLYGGEALAIAVAGALVYLAISLALRMEEPREFWQWTLEKFRRRKTGDKTAALGS